MAIRILEENLVNKIAAGEVVERPASVVKELVENALDAGATQLGVHLRAGGRNLVRIVDDGGGMDRTDALMCLERHATSKIRSEDDLFAVATLGFRGEAVPSIASIAKMEILTRRHDAEVGTRVRIEGGRLVDVEPAGCAPGTDISVASIFFNVPARRKFLRSVETELGHCVEAVTREALIRPALDLELTHDERTLLRCPGGSTPARRAADLLGPHGEALVPVAFSRGHLEVEALVSPVGVHRASGVGTSYLYVNGRFVRDMVLRRAVSAAYAGIVPKDRYPVVILQVRVPAADVDVNVHPAKTEVRFQHAFELQDAIAQGLRQALQDHGIRRPVATEARYRPAEAPVVQERLPIVAQPAVEAYHESHGNTVGNHDTMRAEVSYGGSETPPPPSVITRVDVQPSSLEPVSLERDVRPSAPVVSSAPLVQPGVARPAPVVASPSVAPAPRVPLASVATSGPLPSAPGRITPAAPSPAADSSVSLASSAAPAAPASPSFAPITPAAPAPPVAPEPVRPSEAARQAARRAMAGTPQPDPRALLPVGRFVDLRILGQLADTYVLCEGAGELVIIDQHAAHERVTLYRLMSAPQAALGGGQRLLTPLMVDLAPARARLLADRLDTVARFGLDVSYLGGRTFAVQGVPAPLRGADVATLLADVADDLAEGGRGAGPDQILEHVLATMACHSSVRAGQRLDERAMRELLRALDSVDFSVCAHGRPVAIRIDARELERRFHRA